jgi:hypothetical protein
VNWDLSRRLQTSRPGDQYFDYCLWPYQPIAPVARNGLRSSALLYQSFAYAGVSEKMLAFCDRLVDRWGRFQTVWGVKSVDGRLTWEFYFYDYARLQRRRGLADFCKATQGLITLDVPLDKPMVDDFPYFMFSVEIDERHLNGLPIKQVDLYVGSPGAQMTAGICYGLTHQSRDLRNLYFFFDAKAHDVEIRQKILESAQVPAKNLRVEDVLWSDIDAQTIVCANKRYADSLYFSRVDVGGLVTFMRRLSLPEPIIDWTQTHQHLLAHHYFDVGYDYVADGNGIRPTKGSYYGIL